MTRRSSGLSVKYIGMCARKITSVLRAMKRTRFTDGNRRAIRYAAQVYAM